MWIPYTDSVVVVTNNPVKKARLNPWLCNVSRKLHKQSIFSACKMVLAVENWNTCSARPTCLACSWLAPLLQGYTAPKVKVAYSDDDRLNPLRELMTEVRQDQEGSEEVISLAATQLRDRLIAHNPLDRDWIARVNQVQESSSGAFPMANHGRDCAEFVHAVELAVNGISLKSRQM